MKKLSIFLALSLMSAVAWADGVSYVRCNATSSNSKFEVVEMVHRPSAAEEVITLFLYGNADWAYDPETDEVITNEGNGFFLAIDFIYQSLYNLVDQYRLDFDPGYEELGWRRIMAVQYGNLVDGQWTFYDIDDAELIITLNDIIVDGEQTYRIHYWVVSEPGTENEYQDFADLLDVCMIPKGPVCAKPTNVEITEITANSITLKWEAGSEDPFEWTLIYEEAQNPDESRAALSTEVCEATITDLKPGTAYMIHIFAKCGDDLYSRSTVEYSAVTNPAPEAVEATTAAPWQNRKQLRDGQLLILRGERTYNAVGAKLQ